MHQRIALLTLLVLTLLATCSTSEPKAQVDDSVPAAPSTSADDTSTTSTTEASTPPSTVYAPDTIEGEIEAAYLVSLDAFMSAMTNGDPSVLTSSHTGAALETLTSQVNELVANGDSARFEITHDYEIGLVTDGLARVLDISENHSVTIDRESGEPTEPDPNEELLSTVTLRLENGTWMVSDIAHERRPL